MYLNFAGGIGPDSGTDFRPEAGKNEIRPDGIEAFLMIEGMGDRHIDRDRGKGTWEFMEPAKKSLGSESEASARWISFLSKEIHEFVCAIPETRRTGRAGRKSGLAREHCSRLHNSSTMPDRSLILNSGSSRTPPNSPILVDKFFQGCLTRQIASFSSC
jgi:hypothetical protein